MYLMKSLPQIGVHNGWCYVHPPHLLYLERDFPHSSRHLSSSSINRQMLVLRGSLELTELVDSCHYVIIMELEYLVNWGSAEVSITCMCICTCVKINFSIDCSIRVFC